MTDFPAHLLRFDPADWPAVGVDDTERFRSAAQAWAEARYAWLGSVGEHETFEWAQEWCRVAAAGGFDEPYDPHGRSGS